MIEGEKFKHMKKILGTCLVGVISVCGAVAFAACDYGGEEVLATVTEDNWKNAFAYFAVDWDEQAYLPVLSENPRTNFSCKMNTTHSDNGETASSEVTVSCDFNKWASGCTLINDNDKPVTGYGWKDGNIFYEVGVGSRIESNEKIRYYFKAERTEDYFKMGFDYLIYSCAGGNHILALNLSNKFEEFTYSEENKEYTAAIFYELYLTEANVTVKFKGCMIDSMCVTLNGSTYGDYVFTYDYTYGITVTVPEYYLNMQLGETIIED